MDSRLLRLRTEMEAELRSILDFWAKQTVDRQNGGFYGEIRGDHTVNELAAKGLVLNSRLLWTFSTAYRVYGDKLYLEMAHRGFDYLMRYFRDTEYGGMYWLVDAEGQPYETKKQIYGQSFAIYGLSEYFRASGLQEPLDQAVGLFRLIENHSYDLENGGYFEALARDWGPLEDVSLSDKDMNERKSMNTHLHILEAYSNLLRVWPETELREKQKELIEVTLSHIVNRQTGHFKLFFDEAWHSRSGHISYGHDIEGSWLLLEAAELLGDEELLREVKAVAVQMAEATLTEGTDPDNGGIYNEIDPDGHVDTDKIWWPQAEAIVGFLNAYQMTGRKDFAEAALSAWDFTSRHLIDRERGEWYWKASKEGRPDVLMPKVDPWKCSYHNSRSCFEAVGRINALEAKET